MDTFLTPLENYISDFYERFNQKLSEHNVASLMEGYLGADHNNFSSPMTIPLNFGRECSELYGIILLTNHLISSQPL